MPVLQMKKLRPRAEVTGARPQLSQDVLTWRQGGPGPSIGCLQPRDSVEWQRPLSEGAARFCSRVRLALLQGLSQLPGASRADCLPPPEEGSLLSGLISCQLSVFFLCFCCSLRQTGWGGDRERPSRAGPSQGWGPLPLPCSLRGNTIAQTSLLLWSGLVLSPNCPSLFPGQALQPPRPFCLACLYLQKHPMSGPGSLKARLNSKLPGDDIPAPSQSWPLLLAPPPNTSMGPLFSLQGMTAPLSISQVPALTQPPP